jgi:hypothetical protein
MWRSAALTSTRLEATLPFSRLATRQLADGLSSSHLSCDESLGPEYLIIVEEELKLPKM